MNTKDTPQGKAAAAKSAPASERTDKDTTSNTPGPNEPQFKRVAAAGRDTRAYREWSDEDLTALAVDRGLTVNEVSREELIASHEAYDRHGSQGSDAPSENHPETIKQRAEEDAKRQREAHGA